MERLDSIVGRVEKQIETIIRGGSIGGQNQNEYSQLLKTVRDLFDLVSAYSQRDFNDVEDKTSRVNTAVRLHNKVRNLAPIHVELRTIAKACAAWMLMLFNQPVPKSLCAIIKLLSRSGQDTQQFSEVIALKCCTAATDLWARISVETLSHMMPPLELQDIKIAAFQAYLDRADILVRMKAIQDCSDIRLAIAGAFNIVQSLPDGLKIHFAEQTVTLGARLSSFNIMNEAVYFLQIAVSSIDLLGRSIGTVAVRGIAEQGLSLVDRDELRKLKIKAQLSLAFAFKEMNQCQKAMASIMLVESALFSRGGTGAGAGAGSESGGDVNGDSSSFQSITQTVSYAKFMIFAKDKDWEAAEQNLKNLLQNAPYELAMDVIKTYLEGNQKDTRMKGIELYRLVSSKFPDEPEFTNTRISLVLYILSTAQLQDNAIDEKERNPTTAEIANIATVTNSHKRVIELCNEIISDHKSKKRRLGRIARGRNQSETFSPYGSYERMKKILSERVRWNRSSSQWKNVLIWVDLLIKLLSEGAEYFSEREEDRIGEGKGQVDSTLLEGARAMDQDDKVIAQLQKVDGLLHLGEKDEALRLRL